MMKLSDAFPSKYLKATDLSGREPTVTIERITVEDLGDETKPILYFVGHTKGLVLNVTNGRMLAMDYGDEMDNWINARIQLYSERVAFQGRIVEAIRVRVPADAKPAPYQAPQAAAVPTGVNEEAAAQIPDLNDDIGF